MKKKTTKIILIALLMSFGLNTMAQVAINNDGSIPDASAMLEVKSTDKGFLTPRMTQAQIEAISNPADGLIVYNTTDSRFYFYDDGAGEWKEIAIGTGTITPIPPVGEVYNPITGETWMDRNLGATQVATSSTDAASYGDLYQWGRGTDGHQIRTSATTSTLSSTDVPGHGNFILAPSFPYDWRSPQNDNLWQGVSGVNNPCPAGYRIPTDAELDAERSSWSSNNAAGAFASPLKLPVAGFRHSDGTLYDVGSNGFYWSSTLNGSYSYYLEYLYFSSGSAFMHDYNRARGFSVRCIKD
ncbi:MAG: FISUMP domain-containing protein [Bacteroidota bacterium]